MAQDSKLFKILSGLLSNDEKLKNIINSGVYNVSEKGTIDARLTALSGALNTESAGAYKGVETSGAGNGLTIGDVIDNKQSISLVLADGENAGTVKGGGVATISDGQITAVSEAGKVTNKLTAFGKEFDGSAAAEIKVDDKGYLTQAEGVLSLAVTGEVLSENSGLVTGGAVYTAIEEAKQAITGGSEGGLSLTSIDARVTANENKLSGVTTVSGDIAAAKTKLIGGEFAEGDTIKNARTEAKAAFNAVTDLTSGAVKTNSDNISTVSGTVDKHVAILAGIGGETEPTTVAAAIDADVLAAKNEILGVDNGTVPVNATNSKLRADINANDAEIATLNKALSGYAGENAVSAKFVEIDSKLTGVDENVGASITAAKSELIGLIGTGYETGKTVKDAITAVDTKVGTLPVKGNGPDTYTNVVDYVNAKVTEVSSKAIGVAKGNGIDITAGENNVNTISAAGDGKTIGVDGTGIKSLLTLKKLTSATKGYAASYQLQDVDGSKLGDIINIPKDQFLSGATYVPSSQTLDLTFAVNTKNEFGAVTEAAHTVSIKVSEFFSAYEAGAGLNLNTDGGRNSFEITKDPANDDNKFLQIGDNGIGLSGITEAFTAADTALKTELVGTDESVSTADTIKGTKKYADEKVAAEAAAMIGGTAVDVAAWKAGEGEGSLAKLLADVNTLNGEI